MTLLDSTFPRRQEDKDRIRKAISARRIDPADVPGAAMPPPHQISGAGAPSSCQPGSSSSQYGSSSQIAPSSSQTGPSSSQAVPSQRKRKIDVVSTPAASGSNPQLTQRRQSTALDVVDIDNDPAEEIQDEHYASVTTKVAGTQYYTGTPAAALIGCVALILL